MIAQQPADVSEHFKGVRLATPVLAIATALAIYFCWLLLVPFLKAITWALALAVAAHPFHRWVKRNVGRRNMAAAISVLLVTMILTGPGIPLIQALTHEASTAIKQIQENTTFAA